jgi:ribosomal protein S18 acetylase RimI-like enzyme
MDIHVTLAGSRDEEFLWRMLYHAAHMEQDAGASIESAKEDPYLRKYVVDWGRPGDLGVIGAVDGRQVGAVWSRLLIGDNRTYGYVDDNTPELAAAVLPEYIGNGIGTRLLHAYLAEAEKLFPAVALNVRADNPALRLYRRAGFEVVSVITNRVGTESYNMVRWFTAAET